MFINEKLKLNVLRQVRIPSNAEYFARYGFATSPSSQFSGDDDSPMPKNKTELFALMDEYDRMKQAEESQSNNSKD